MKLRFCSKLTIALGLSFINLPTFSAVTIYGVEQAGKIKTQSGGEFYIQAGSFVNKRNAYNYQSMLKSKSRYPVFIKQKHNHYNVIIGPVKSASEVRTVAQGLGSKSVPVPVSKTVSHSQHIMTAPKQAPTPRQMSIQNAPYKDMPVHVSYSAAPHGWFVGAAVGMVDPAGTDATNYATSGMPGFPDDKYVGNGGDNSVFWSVVGGYQWQRDAEWLPAFSLGFAYTRTVPKINGVIYVNGLSDAKNFTYKYDVTQQLPMATFKLDLYDWNHFMPYISAGAGAAINTVQNYSDEPIPGATLWNRGYGFTSSRTTNFAGSIGAGIDYWIANKTQLSLGYQYTSAGTVTTGYGEGVLSSNQLSSKLNTNSVGLQAVYFVD